MVKSGPRPTRWHCGWRYQHLRTKAEFRRTWQLQSRLCGSDFQHQSLCLEPHSAVLPIQQLFGTLSRSKFRLFQITISLFFFSRSSTIIFFHFLDLPQNIPEVQEIFRKLVSLSVLSGWFSVCMSMEGYKFYPTFPKKAADYRNFDVTLTFHLGCTSFALHGQSGYQ